MTKTQQKSEAIESPQLRAIREKLSQSKDFSIAVTEIALEMQEKIDSGGLDASEVMGIVCTQGERRGKARPETAKEFTSAIKSARKLHHYSESPKPVLTDLNGHGSVNLKSAVIANTKLAPEVPIIRTVRLSDVVRELVSWLWFPRIPVGKVTILEGEEGLGKSWFICTLAGIVTTGASLPDGSQVQQGNVLMLSAEDGLGDTIKPRLEAVGADCERIFAVDEPLILDEKGFQKLEYAIAEHQPILVTIDPIFAYTGKVNANQAHESRGISARLAEIATKFQCAILIVRHIGKSKGFGDARAAGLGSIDWRAAARSVLLIGKDPDDETKRAIVQTKNNLERPAEAIGFQIREGCFYWTGKSDLTAERILTTLSANDEDAQFKNDAVDFLQKLLKDGKLEAEDVEKARRRASVSDYSLRQAKAALGVKPYKVGFGKSGTWYWALPDNTESQRQDDGTDEDASKDVEACAKASKALTQNENQHLSVNGSHKSSYNNNLPKGVESNLNQRLSGKNSTPLEKREVFEL